MAKQDVTACFSPVSFLLQVYSNRANTLAFGTLFNSKCELVACSTHRKPFKV
jgi:hypothetical protein